VLGTHGNSTGLVFVDNSGNWLLALGATTGGASPSAGLAVFDGNSILPGTGVACAAVGISSQGAALTAMNGDGKPALISGVAADSSSAGSFVLDSSGYSRAGFGNASNGSGVFVKDSNNVTRYVAGVGANGAQAGAVTFDASGKPQVAVGGNGDGSSAGMVTLDGMGLDRFDAGFSSANGGGLLVKDQNGNVIWYAPEPAGQ